MKVKIPLSMKIRNLFSPCRKCKKGIGYHCLYCYKKGFDHTAPQTKVNILSKHILDLQADKGRLTDRCRELEAENAELKEKIRLIDEQEAKDIRTRFPC